MRRAEDGELRRLIRARRVDLRLTEISPRTCRSLAVSHARRRQQFVVRSFGEPSRAKHISKIEVYSGGRSCTWARASYATSRSSARASWQASTGTPVITQLVDGGRWRAYESASSVSGRTTVPISKITTARATRSSPPSSRPSMMSARSLARRTRVSRPLVHHDARPRAVKPGRAQYGAPVSATSVLRETRWVTSQGVLLADGSYSWLWRRLRQGLGVQAWRAIREDPRPRP